MLALHQEEGRRTEVWATQVEGAGVWGTSDIARTKPDTFKRDAV